jgi:hypothetical protein
MFDINYIANDPTNTAVFVWPRNEINKFKLTNNAWFGNFCNRIIFGMNDSDTIAFMIVYILYKQGSNKY